MITVRLSTGLGGVAERALGFLVWRRWQFFDAKVGVDDLVVAVWQQPHNHSNHLGFAMSGLA